MAAIEMFETAHINCPPEKAFAIMANLDNHPDIFENNHEIRGHNGGLTKQGDTWEVVTSFMGREITTTFTMAEVDEPRRLVYSTESSAATGEITWQFEAVNGGTQVNFSSKGVPKGFFATVAGPLLKNNVTKMMKKEIQRFKEIAEA